MRGPKFAGRESSIELVTELSGTQLAHPVYLDVPMLVSFLAALEGGVSFEDQSTRRSGSSTRNEREGGGGVGARVPVLPSILSLDISGRLRSELSQEDAQEVVAVRRHTEASLFNVLRHRLEVGGAITTVSAAEQLARVAFGDLVQVSGEVVGNPLQQLLALLLQFASVAGVDLDAMLSEPEKQPKTQRNRQGKTSQPARPSQPAVEDEDTAAVRQFVALVGDMLGAPVQDYVMDAEGEFRAVLTLATEFITPQAGEYLKASDLRVLGKVTRVVSDDDDPINLTRRSSLGALGSESIGDMFRSITGGLDPSLAVNIADPLVAPPAVQVLPLAIFV